MIEHTHDKDKYAVVIGRKVILMARPEKTRQKAYREPVIVERRVCKNKAEANAAKDLWEGRLV